MLLTFSGRTKSNGCIAMRMAASPRQTRASIGAAIIAALAKPRPGRPSDNRALQSFTRHDGKDMTMTFAIAKSIVALHGKQRFVEEPSWDDKSSRFTVEASAENCESPRDTFPLSRSVKRDKLACRPVMKRRWRSRDSQRGAASPPLVPHRCACPQ